MSIQVKLRRGTTSQHSTFTGAEGEVTIDTDKDVVVVHDGTTVGGHPLVKATSLATVATSGDYNDLINKPTGVSGTVTSVALSAPTGFTVSGSPVTTAGTLGLSFDTGYSLPTTTKQGQWDTAYSWGNHATAGYLTSYTETDPVVGAVNGLVKANGSGSISAAIAGTDYLAPSAIGTTVQAYDADLTTWAGKTAPSGTVVGDTDTQTLTNKNIQERVVSIADGTSITMNADTTDLATQANTQAAGTLTINAPTGTPVNGQKLMLRLQSTNVQTFSWNSVFTGSTDLVLPTASSGSSKYDYVGFIYNSTAAKWQLIAKNFGF